MVCQETVKDLALIANKVRVEVIEICHNVGPERKAHPGPALSIVDILVALYFHVMKVDPAQPRWAERDRFILSKGHACPALYAVLAEKGYFPKELLTGLRHIGSMLQGHPDMTKTPGIDMTTGSLGHGLSAGLGMALAARIDGKDHRIFVLLGDGEMQEGLVWEAAMFAGNSNMGNVTAVIDCNGLQSTGSTPAKMNAESIAGRWQSFGWDATLIDGHDMEEIVGSFDCGIRSSSAPRVIVAKTVKGKGVSFMENNNEWHQRSLSRTEYLQALTELASERGKAP